MSEIDKQFWDIVQAEDDMEQPQLELASVGADTQRNIGSVAARELAPFSEQLMKPLPENAAPEYLNPQSSMYTGHSTSSNTPQGNKADDAVGTDRND